MSDLPEDLSRWPADPYELLGVGRSIGPRELRRAYTRLIRTYKPEQYPEHFRRIREAYENVKRQVEFFKSMNISFADEEENDNPGEDSKPSADDTETLTIMPRPWQPAVDTSSELDELWQRACGGDEQAVYRRLVELHQQRPGQADVCLRLYWLLALTPELDPKQSPCHWLAQGLYANGVSGPLRELYRREIADDPNEALSQRCTRLLHMTMNPAQLADLTQWRWEAAGRTGTWKIIDDDLEILYDRLADDETETWVQLLIAAAEQLAALDGDGPRQLLHECWRQIGHFEHAHAALADSLDRLEFLLEVSAGVQKLRARGQAIEIELAWLVAQSWTRPFSEMRPRVLAFLEKIARQPHSALRDFERIQRLAGPVLTQFGNFLTLIEAGSDDYGNEQRSPELVARVLGNFLDEHVRDSYQELRPQLLDFLLRECIPPELAAEAIGHLALAQEINEDLPLRYVCLAARVFWM